MPTAPCQNDFWRSQHLGDAAPECQRYEAVAGEIVGRAPEHSGHALTKANIWRRLTEAVECAGLTRDVYPEGMSIEVDTPATYERDVQVGCGAPVHDETVRSTDPGR